MKNSDYEHLIKTAPYGFAYHKIIKDETGKPIDYEFLEVNSAFEKLTDLSAEKIIGKTVRQAIPGIENSEFDWIGFYGNIAINGGEKKFEQYSEPLGRWFSVHAYSPEKGYFTTIFNDITDKKNAELALKESYEMLHNLTVQMPGVVYQYRLYPDGSSCFPYSSKGMWNIYEVTSDEVREDASPVFTRIHPDDYDMVSNLINESARNQTNFVCEFRVILPEQGLRWRHSNAKPHLMPDCSTLWYGIITDITERKNAEKAIRENEEKLRAIFQTANIGINITDRNGRILFVNDWWVDFIGYSFKELTEKANLDFTDPDDVAMSKEYFSKIFTKELKQYRIEKRFIRKDGTVLWADLSVTPIFKIDGTIENIVGMTIDITEKKNAEVELIHKNSELEQQYEEYMQLNEVLQATNNDLEISKSKAEESDRLKTAFLQNMSHEIRTPLNGIIGFSNLLEDEDISKDEIKECTSVIKQSGSRLIEIVNNVLDISKIETGQIETTNKTFSVNSLIGDLYNFFAPMAESKELNLSYLIPLEDEDSLIFADDAKLHQILSNLISNALKFTLNGSISFGYQIKCDRIEFYVQDTGIGISQDMQNRIFERFTQVESGLARSYEGAGLGLSICQGLVNLLGGEIRLESEIGIGSKFCFDIPLIRDIVKQVENNEINENKIIGGKMKILIAEDDYTSYLYLCNVFKKDSYEIIQAKNGLQAVEFVKNIPDIDLVLMDIRMPELDGIEATKQIKELRPDLPIIAQTAYAFIEERKVIMAAGCDEYISKPIDKTLLLSLVSKYIKIDK